MITLWILLIYCDETLRNKMVKQLQTWHYRQNGVSTYRSTIRSSVRLRMQSVRPFSPSSTSCWQEGHGNKMGGGAASLRFRPGYVPHTGDRTQVCRGESVKDKEACIQIEGGGQVLLDLLIWESWSQQNWLSTGCILSSSYSGKIDQHIQKDQHSNTPIM